MVSAIITVGAIVIAIELVLWRLFNRKVRGLSFPHESDESLFRSFTPLRLRIGAILHTLFLIGIFVLLSIFLW